MNAAAARLSDLGEDRLVARLTRGLPGHPALRLGPGDDCAVVASPSGASGAGGAFQTLLKTDCVIEGVHFAPGDDFRRVGWKAMARAVSDIAAMGGEPEHALVTVAFPPTLEVARADALYTGLRRCARRFGISIAGGETARVPGTGPVFVAVTLTGRVEKGRCITRAGGRPGDALFVTGLLGGSRAGKHLDFMPRLAEARWLAAHCRPRAMMDLSDGLGADLPRLARASGCGYELGDLPCAPGCSREEALGDGEDFELLFAVSPRMVARLQRQWPFAKLPLTRIGRLTAPRRAGILKTIQTAQTAPSPSPVHGFDHFARPERDL